MSMTKGNLINNTKTRRKGSMLQDSISKIKYLIVLAFLLVIPMQAKAGLGRTEPIDQTDTGANRLVYYYDEVGRHTYIQLTNTSDELACVHVQVFQAESGCNEVDFDDCLSAGDTNVYDMENLPGSPILSDSNGFVAVSLTDGPDFSLIGMFRIIDDNGFEYRTNAAGSEDPLAFEELYNILNFNDVTGNNLSDVVGITYVGLSQGQVYASPFVGTVFGNITEGSQNLIFDEFEDFNSCSPALFTCDNNNSGFGGYINRGIDNSIPNSQSFPILCNTTKLSADNSAGWVFMPFVTFLCGDGFVCDLTDGDPLFDVFFVGFLGLNNGDGTGSMDSWMSFFNPSVTDGVATPQ